MHHSCMITLVHSPVSSDPEILGGTLVFNGTRVPVQTLLDYMNDGYCVADFVDLFPSVDRDDAEAFLKLVHESA